MHYHKLRTFRSITLEVFRKAPALSYKISWIFTSLVNVAAATHRPLADSATLWLVNPAESSAANCFPWELQRDVTVNFSQSSMRVFLLENNT
jgi:hypothetical protein